MIPHIHNQKIPLPYPPQVQLGPNLVLDLPPVGQRTYQREMNKAPLSFIQKLRFMMTNELVGAKMLYMIRCDCNTMLL